MSNRNVEFQVTLGLQEAQNQLNTLRDLLQKSVKVDSSAFKDIERLLDRLATQADGLKGKMGDAFKTSASSKQFLKQYEQLFTALESVKGKFTSLGLNDIAFSSGDAQFVDETLAKIKQLQGEIDNLEKGKIGKIFDDNTIDGADKIRAFVADLGKDLNSMTFSGLSAALTKELKSVQDQIETTEKYIGSLRSQISALSGNQLDELMNKMNTAVNGAVDQSSATFKPEQILDYRKAIEDFYSMYNSYTGDRKKNDTTGSVESWIKKEAAGIADGIELMKQKFAEYEQALADLNKIQSSGVKGIEAKSQIDDIASRLGLTFDASSFTRYDQALSALRAKITELKGSFTSETDITDLGQKMLDSLAHVFDHVDLNRTLNISNLKSQLTAIFKEIGVDISDPAIAQIFNSITKNMNLGDFSAVFSKQIEDYKQKHEAMAQQVEADNQKLKASEQDLKDMSNTVNTQIGAKDNSIREKQEEIENLHNTLQKLVDEFNKANGTNFQLFNSSNVEQGKRAIESLIDSLTRFENKQKALSNISMAITRWMGFYQVLNLTKRAINQMKQHIQELDSVMTRIAVVTNMTQDDLWNQIGKYSEIARQYGVAIKGVYEVSQLYYQQGLNKGDVMGLTTETLKMARIAGIDYSTAADYMTTAIRGFKLEMADAAHVTDVFSNLAAHTASSTEELATAISKTAASAASVGASFEATSAMMATMIATTRESATNIGTALKSIISRYGEMKSNPTGIDAEGEEYSLNKVDKALQTVGIKIHDVNGQFRNFDDVILELAEAWDTIDKNTQRYIATVMAGNRQQSRFLALVSNVEEYKRALDLANDSSDTGDIQTLKTLDSIDAKIERMKVTIQEFYTSSGLQDLYKNILDTITNVINGANSLPKVFGKIPMLALTLGIQVINIIKNVAKLFVSTVSASIEQLKGNTSTVLSGIVRIFAQKGTESGQALKENAEREISKIGTGAKIGAIIGQRIGSLVSLAGSAVSLAAMNAYGSSTSKSQDLAAGSQMALGAGLNAAGSAISGAATGLIAGASIGGTAGPIGAIIGAVLGLASGIPDLITAINMNNVTLKREVELNQKQLQETKQTETTAKGRRNELENARDKLKQLEEVSRNSAESLQEYHEYMNQLAESYPNLISQIEVSGDRIIELTTLEAELANARLKTAQATLETTEVELAGKKLQKQNYETLQQQFNKINNEKIVFDKGAAYSLLFGKNMTSADERNASEKILEQYNQWAAHTDNAPIATYKSTFEAGEWIRKNTDAMNAYMEALISSMDLAVGGDYQTTKNSRTKVLSQKRDNLANAYIKILKEAQETASAGGETLDLDFIVGKNIESLDDIKNWSYTEIKESLENANDKIQTYINSINNTIEGVSNSLNNAALNLGIQQNLNSMDNRTQANTAQEYSSLMSFMLGGRYKYKVDWNTEQNQAIISELRDWILENEETATDLMALDFTQYSNPQQILDSLNKDDLAKLSSWDEYYNKSIVPAFKDARNKVLKGFSEQLTNVKLEGEFDDLIGTNEIEGTLITSLITPLRSSITQYQKLIKEELTESASAYKNSFVEVYKSIGSLPQETQVSLESIINDLDLQDTDSISKAIETLKDLDPDFYKDLITALERASLRIVTNIQLQLEQLRESSKELAKNIEKVTDNIGKGLKLSEAIEQANEILSNYSGDEGYTYESLYNWDETLGGYVLTVTGIHVWIENINKEAQDNIDDLSKSLKETLTIYDALKLNGPEESLNIEALKQSLRTLYSDTDESGAFIVSDEDINARAEGYAITYKTLLDKYNEQDKLGWEDWLDSQKELLTNITEKDIEFFKNLPRNELLNKLVSLDYSSIAGGTGNSYKNILQQLLKESFENDYTDEIFSTIWEELLQGKFDTLKNLLNGTGFSISEKTESSAAEASIKQYTNAISELMNVPFENWSKATKQLIGSTMKPSSEKQLSDPDFIQNTIDVLYDHLEQEIDGVKYTVDQYNQDILALNEYRGFGKTKASIDLISGGFDIEDFRKYLQLIDPSAKIEDYFNFETKQFKKELNGINFASLFTYDEVTNSFKANTAISIESAVDTLVTTLRISTEKATEIWNSMIDSSINEQIQVLDTVDIGKQASNQISTLANAKVGTRVAVNRIPSEIREKLGIDGDFYEIISEFQRDQLIMALDETALDEEWKEVVKELQNNIKQKRNKGNTYQNLIAKTVTKDQAKAYLESIGRAETDAHDFLVDTMHYIYDPFTDTYTATKKTLDSYDSMIRSAETASNKNPEYIAQLKKARNDIAYALEADPMGEALKALLSSYENVSDDVLSEFSTQFSINIDNYVTSENGIKKVNIERLKKDLGDKYQSYFDDYIAQIADSYIENASKIGNLLTSGTTSQVEMQGFQKAYSELMGGESVDFFYDSVLQAWTIDASKIRGYLEQVAAKLNLGDNASQWVEDQIQTLTVDNLDFSNYLSGTASQKDQTKLKHDLKNYFKAYNKDYMPYMGSLEEWAEQRTDNLLASLDKGGQEAVDALKSVKGELTTEEIQNAYRAQVAPIKALYDQIDELQVGSVVAKNQINALTKAGFTVNANGVVTTVGNLVEAYKSLYDQMKDTGEATLAEINEALGKYLDNRDGEQQAIDALSNAANMTYSQLAEIYTQAGIELTEELVDAMEEVGIIKGLGGNKLMIQDFRAFAKQMNWGEGSEEYINAFKAYNDSLIEYDRQTEKSIVEEIKNVAAAKPGDKINLTHFVSQLENGLDTILVATGARIQNGILTISEGADLADITNQLLAMVPESVKLIPDEIAEIADAVNTILQQIASLIKEGINGTLSNANKQSLTSWGNANGLNLQFTQTAEGFKLAQESAIQVYYTLKSIDALQGKLVFDELNKSLQEANEHYKSISDIANRIAWIENEAHPERATQYAQELALAKEIYAVRSTTEDSSFSFMSNKIPGAQNNPINYFNNWVQAIHTFNDALKTQGTYTKGGKTYQSGFVDYDFWYNLVTEMNNIAALGGNIEFAGEELDGSLEAASKLIQKGAESLVVTDTGEVKVALSGMSLDFAAGADAFSSNVTEGIQALAKSQSKMLDGLIKLLEAVVAMEKLGDIDVGDNGILDLSELFEVKTGEQNWTIAEKNLVGFNAFIEQAGDSLDSIIINGQKFTDLAEKAKVEGLDKATAENFTAIMNSLYQMYRSGDYNLDNLYDSIQQIMAQSKFTGELQLGDTILHVKNGAVIIETEDKKGKKKFQTPNGDTYDTMGEAIARSAVMAQGIKDGITYEGEIATGNIEIKTLGANITITSDKEGNLTFKNGDGEPISAANINEYIQTLIDAKKLEPTEAAKLKTNVGLEIGTVKLDSFSYKSIDSKIREEFEKKLASGSQIEVDTFIDANPVLKQFKGKTGAEIQEILHLDDVKIIVDNKQAIKGISAVEEQLKKLHDKTITITTINKEVSDKSGLKKTGNTQGILQPLEPISPGKKTVGAAGNIGLANAKGTLMGELGPELVVSEGHYFVVGQSGPEMVNLAEDAIVFNHLQTESLLKKGMSKGRGKAVTNERNAVSFATGNVNGGPAKASASAALQALRQLKAQWDALAGLSAKDLAGKGGGGGGGGGDPKAFLKDLERWYDWLQQIAQLEKEITLEEAKRAKYQSDMVARGKEYFTSQMASLEKLQEQAVVQQSLNDSQEEYFQKRLEELNEQSAFSALYGFSESGQLYYKDVYADGKGAFEWLSDLVGRDEETGKANYTAEEQYNKLVEAGFGFAMQYDSAGNEIKHEGTDWYNTALQAFWDKIDRDKEEMQSLHDAIEDGKKKVLDLQAAQNEILHEIEDNQIEVEQKVLKAVEEMRQRAIDQMKDNKDALEEGAKALTDGLSKQLDNERKMLDNQKNADELASLQRRLGILQRSGGSASQIADLQQQITDKQQDKYFDMQEQQIQAIQDASDAEIERLDRQIELEEEQLEYEKEHGMLWMDVDDVLKKSSEDIVNFIQGNTSEYWSKSTTELQKVLREDLFEVDRFKQFQATVEEGMDALIEKYGTEEQKKALADKKRAEAKAEDAEAAVEAAVTEPANNKQAPTPKNEPPRITGTGEFTYKPIDDTYHMKSEKLSNGTFKDRGKEKHNFVDGKCSRCGYSALKLNKGPINDKFANALVSNQETQDLLSSEKALLQHKSIDISQSALASFQSAYKGLSSNAYDSIQNNSNKTTIERAEVNLNIDKLANDYDAKRAADTVMDEMLRLASKTIVNNSVRR